MNNMHNEIQIYPVLSFYYKSEDLKNYTAKAKRYKLDPSHELFLTDSLQKFVIADFDVSATEIILEKLRSSVWWNPRGYYLINNMQSYNSCADAFSFLKTFWKFNILSVIFMCTNQDYEINLFTYNPFTARAPKNWKKYKTFKQGGFLYIFDFKYDSNGKILLHF